MRTIRVDTEKIPEKVIGEICATLKNGGTIIYPTETVYGLGADIFNQQAVAKVCSAKGRDSGKALSITLSDVSEIGKYAYIENESQRQFIYKNLPGPFTVILKKKEIVPDWISKDTVGIRIPECAGVRKLVKKCGPITATSANPSGQPAPTRAEEIKIQADLLLDGGETRYKKASAVFDLTKMEVLRA